MKVYEKQSIISRFYSEVYFYVVTDSNGKLIVAGTPEETFEDKLRFRGVDGSLFDLRAKDIASNKYNLVIAESSDDCMKVLVDDNSSSGSQILGYGKITELNTKQAKEYQSLSRYLKSRITYRITERSIYIKSKIRSFDTIKLVYPSGYTVTYKILEYLDSECRCITKTGKPITVKFNRMLRGASIVLSKSKGNIRLEINPVLRGSTVCEYRCKLS